MCTTCPNRELLPLLAAGELEGERRAELERHVAACDECRLELGRLRALADALILDLGRGQRPADSTCREAEAVMAYADGSLEEARRGPVEAHLASCSACRRLLADLWTMHGPETADPPEWVVRRVLERLAADATPAVVRVLKDGLELVRGFADASVAPQPSLAGARGTHAVALAWSGPDAVTVELDVQTVPQGVEVVGRALVNGAADCSITVELEGPAGRAGPDSPDKAGRFGPWGIGFGRSVIRVRSALSGKTSSIGLLLEDETTA